MKVVSLVIYRGSIAIFQSAPLFLSETDGLFSRKIANVREVFNRPQRPNNLDVQKTCKRLLKGHDKTFSKAKIMLTSCSSSFYTGCHEDRLEDLQIKFLICK